ncbi:MAG TPA: NADH-quinone oxidoreductase subunit C [Actinomycetota bacterium]|nr:NADH-quinone oxidoreductase subunit C [Actinomycetota bacterium]
MTAYEPEWVQPDKWRARAETLHAEGWQVRDLCGLDALTLGFEHRFEAVVQLIAGTGDRRTIHVVAAGDPPTAPSVVDLWPTVRFMEREAYDLVGIHFDGHEGLSRIMLPDEWEGHPLRKDYGVGKVAVEFIPQPFLQVDAPGQSTMKDEAQVRLDRLGQVVEAGTETETAGS